MSGEAILERRYRRLLAWYPASHRQAHQDEMLGVLMAATPDGRRRPGLADTADLIWGALRLRARPGNGDTEAWRDALAVLSLVIPIVLVAIMLIFEALQLVTAGTAAIPWLDGGRGYLRAGGAGMSVLFRQRVMWTLHVAGPLALLCAVAARRRGLAIGLTACLCALTIIRYTPIDQFAVVSVVGAISLLLLEVAALATSSGLGRGLELLSWRHVAWPAAAVGLPLAAVGQLLPRLTGGLSTGGDGLTVGAAAVGVLVLVALIAKSAVDKRLCLLLAVAIYTLVIEYAAADGGYAGRGWPSLQRFYLEVPLACLPVLVTAALAARMLLQRSRATAAPADRPDPPGQAA